MKRRLFSHLPTAILYAAILAAIIILALTRNAPEREWTVINTFVFLGLGITLALVYEIFWKKPPPCDLFSGREDEPAFDHEGEIYYQKVYRPCGAPSVGSVRLSYTRATVYFCTDHDPEIGWMKEWLDRKKYSIDLKTVKRFVIN